MYLDDDLVLDIKLNTLNKDVDHFIIVEATLDHAGNKKKIKSFAHQEFNLSNLTSLKVKKRVESGIDIFDRPYKYRKINLNDQFPDCIPENRSKFKDWII